MIKLFMKNKYLHNTKNVSDDKFEKKITQFSSKKSRCVVDINILLNRVKIEEKNETKRKIVFYSSVTLGLSFIAILISIIN